MSRSVIILGASARAAAFSAIAAGYTPYAIDLFADCDLAAACDAVQIRNYPHDFLAALAAAPQSPWIYTGGIENYPRLIDRLARIRPLWGNRGTGLRAVRNPFRLAELASAAGLEFPETLPAPSGIQDFGDGAAQWLVKAKHSSGGLGVRLAQDTDLGKQLRHHYWQRCVPGSAASASFVLQNRKPLILGCTRQLLGSDVGCPERPFLYAGSIGPFTLPSEQTQQLADFGNLLATDCGLVGLIGVDFVLGDDNRLWVVEVNPRYTASMEVLERTMGMGCFALHASGCAGDELSRDDVSSWRSTASTRPIQSGKQIIYARNDCTIPKSFEGLVAELNPPGESPGIADLPATGARFSAGQPIATIFARGQSEQAVMAELQRLAAHLESLLTPDA